METNANIKQKNCVYCGRFFKPDQRVGDRQKICKEKECQTRRKKESQKKWVDANAGYFEGRYTYVREWRRRNPDYQRRWREKRREIQDEIPSGNPVKTLRLVIPEKWLQGEIQDEITLVRHCGCGVFIAGGVVQDTRRDCLSYSPPVA